MKNAVIQVVQMNKSALTIIVLSLISSCNRISIVELNNVLEPIEYAELDGLDLQYWNLEDEKSLYSAELNGCKYGLRIQNNKLYSQYWKEEFHIEFTKTDIEKYYDKYGGIVFFLERNQEANTRFIVQSLFSKLFFFGQIVEGNDTIWIETIYEFEQDNLSEQSMSDESPVGPSVH